MKTGAAENSAAEHEQAHLPAINEEQFKARLGAGSAANVRRI
jgi:hypothetical protein